MFLFRLGNEFIIRHRDEFKVKIKSSVALVERAFYKWECRPRQKYMLARPFEFNKNLWIRSIGTDQAIWSGSERAALHLPHLKLINDDTF